MSTITLYPLGNADTYRVDLPGGQKLLFDYADMRCATDPTDKRAKLPDELRADLKAAGRDRFDVVAFTHFDDDHVCGAASFFWLEHASKYQGDGRIKIDELWVPAWAITETKEDLCEDGKILRAEARYRLEKGERVRVFSRPAKLEAWLNSRGLTLTSRQHLITDAGLYVPGWEPNNTKGLEMFVHSPFAHRQDDGTFDDRNTNCLIFQASFRDGGGTTRAMLMGDTTYECIADFVRITRFHGRIDRLKWDIVKLPHHSSYKSLGPEKGTTETKPDSDVADLYETYGDIKPRLVSSSKPIPSNDDDDQPPHRQAANYYKRIARHKSGEYVVTMEHPSIAAPAPLAIEIDWRGATVKKPGGSVGFAAVSTQAPRAG
ncbi:MAG: hypothetical protein V4550_08845 [Gemmatimonadota bacterium]